MGNQVVIPSMGNWYIDPLKKNGITVQSILESGTFFLTLDCIDDKKNSIIVKAYESDSPIENNNIFKSCVEYNKLLKDSNVGSKGISIYTDLITKQNLAFICRKKHQFTLSQRLEEYPPLEPIEKQWIAFKFMKLVLTLHKGNLFHGSINPDNVFVDSDLQINIGDMAPFKPSYVKNTRPDLFHHLFATASRSSCYLAPEQLLSPDRASADMLYFHGSFEMDYFSAGLVLYYLYTGEHLFTFLKLNQYKMGKIEINSQIEKLPNEIRKLVASLLSLDPSQRNLDSKNLYEYFPEIFSDINKHFSLFVDPNRRFKRKIKRSLKEFSTDQRLILLNLFLTFLNKTRIVQKKVKFASFICQYTNPLSDMVKLNRVLPYFCNMLTIPSNIVKCTALSCIVKLVQSIDSIPDELTSIFSGYLIPFIFKIGTGASVQFRFAMASLCPVLAVEIERLQPASEKAMEMVNFIINEENTIVIGAFVETMKALSQQDDKESFFSIDFNKNWSPKAVIPLIIELSREIRRKEEKNMSDKIIQRRPSQLKSENVNLASKSSSGSINKIQTSPRVQTEASKARQQKAQAEGAERRAREGQKAEGAKNESQETSGKAQNQGKEARNEKSQTGREQAASNENRVLQNDEKGNGNQNEDKESQVKAQNNEAQNESSEKQSDENETLSKNSEAQAEENITESKNDETQAEENITESKNDETQPEENRAESKNDEEQAEENQIQSNAQIKNDEMQPEENRAENKNDEEQAEETENKNDETQAEENQIQSNAQIKNSETQAEEAESKNDEAQANEGQIQSNDGQIQSDTQVKGSEAPSEEAENISRSDESQADESRIQNEIIEKKDEAESRLPTNDESQGASSEAPHDEEEARDEAERSQRTDESEELANEEDDEDAIKASITQELRVDVIFQSSDDEDFSPPVPALVSPIIPHDGDDHDNGIRLLLGDDNERENENKNKKEKAKSDNESIEKVDAKDDQSQQKKPIYVKKLSNFLQSGDLSPRASPRLSVNESLSGDSTHKCKFETFEHFSTILISCLNSNNANYKVRILHIFTGFYDNSLFNERCFFRRLYSTIAPIILGFLGDDSTNSNPTMVEGYLEFILWYVQRNLLSKVYIPELFLRLSKYRKSENRVFRFYAEKIMSYLPSEFDVEKVTTFINQTLFPQKQVRPNNMRRSSLFVNQSKSGELNNQSSVLVKKNPLMIKTGLIIKPKFIESHRISIQPIRHISPHYSGNLRAILADDNGQLFAINKAKKVGKCPSSIQVNKKVLALAELRHNGQTCMICDDKSLNFIDWKSVKTYSSRKFPSSPIKIIPREQNVVYILCQNRVLYLCDMRSNRSMSIAFNKVLTPSALTFWWQSPTIGIGFKEGFVDLFDPRVMLVFKSIVTEPVYNLVPVQRDLCNFAIASDDKVIFYDAARNDEVEFGRPDLSIFVDSPFINAYDGNVILTGVNDVFHIDCANFAASTILGDFYGRKYIGIMRSNVFEIERNMRGFGSLHKHSSKITCVENNQEMFVSGDVNGFVNIWSLSGS